MRWKMVALCIIFSFLPFLCQKLSKLAKNWRNSKKPIMCSNFETRCTQAYLVVRHGGAFVGVFQGDAVDTEHGGRIEVTGAAGGRRWHTLSLYSKWCVSSCCTTIHWRCRHAAGVTRHRTGTTDRATDVETDQKWVGEPHGTYARGAVGPGVLAAHWLLSHYATTVDHTIWYDTTQRDTVRERKKF